MDSQHDNLIIEICKPLFRCAEEAHIFNSGIEEIAGVSKTSETDHSVSLQFDYCQTDGQMNEDNKKDIVSSKAFEQVSATVAAFCERWGVSFKIHL